MSNPMANSRVLRFTDFTGGLDNCLDYASHTDVNSAYYAPLGSQAEVWKDGQVRKFFVEDTGETPDGVTVIRSVAGGYSGSLRWKLYGTTGSAGVSVNVQHSLWPDGLIDEEIHRITLGVSEGLEVKRLEIHKKDGSAPDANLKVSVAESTDGGTVWSELTSTTDLLSGSPIITATAGAIVATRITNNTGSDQTCCIAVVMGIK